MLLQVHRHAKAAGERSRALCRLERTIQRYGGVEQPVLGFTPSRAMAAALAPAGRISRKSDRAESQRNRALFVQTRHITLNDLGAQRKRRTAPLPSCWPACPTCSGARPPAHARAPTRGWCELVCVEEEAPAFGNASRRWQDHKLSMAYGRSDGEAVERLVDPLGLVVRAYLVFDCGVEGELRTYRVSQVKTGGDCRTALCARPILIWPRIGRNPPLTLKPIAPNVR
ncbi:MAG: WYL domain-containing protein [Caldilineaceae bacterium]